MTAAKRLLFCSWYAFDPATWAVLEKLVKVHGYEATVLAPASVYVGKVYSPTGYLTPDRIDRSAADIRLLPLIDPQTPTNGFAPGPLSQALADLRPDAIWIYGEPTDGITRQILKHFYFRTSVTIACFLAENLWQRPPQSQRIKAQILCHRINALLACGSASSQNAYQVFMPRRVKSYTVFMPNFDPREIGVGNFQLPRNLNDFWIGFVGKLSEEKGWQVLLEALTQLPERVKAIFVGEGPDLEKLQALTTSRGLQDRLVIAGALGPPDVRAVYAQVDVVVVPSLTTPRWMEQFGRVIAEAMAAGKPVVGSSSGAIPEVIADAGLIVDEGNAEMLTAALEQLLDDKDLLNRLSEKARQRFVEEFSIDVYAQRLDKILRRSGNSIASFGQICTIT